MEKIINKYRIAAHLSYQTIIHLKHLLPSEDTTLIFLDVKHMQDTKYMPTIIPISNSVDFEKAYQQAIFSICKQLQSNLDCAQQPVITKKKVFSGILFMLE